MRWPAMTALQLISPDAGPVTTIIAELGLALVLLGAAMSVIGIITRSRRPTAQQCRAVVTAGMACLVVVGCIRVIQGHLIEGILSIATGALVIGGLYWRSPRLPRSVRRKQP